MRKGVRAKKGQECYLCGAKAASRDHVPPKNLFPQPRPSNLITLPCCEGCNGAASKDEEYFRWFLVTASADNPVASNLIHGPVIRGLRRKPRLLYSIMAGAIPRVEMRSPGGIILGHRPAFKFDRSRVQATIDKVIRGLFFKHSRRRLRPDYKVFDFILNPNLSDEWKATIFALPLRETSDRVFGYRFSVAVDDPDASMCWMMFFERALVMCMTGPPEQISSSNAHG